MMSGFLRHLVLSGLVFFLGQHGVTIFPYEGGGNSKLGFGMNLYQTVRKRCHTILNTRE